MEIIIRFYEKLWQNFENICEDFVYILCEIYENFVKNCGYFKIICENSEINLWGLCDKFVEILRKALDNFVNM